MNKKTYYYYKKDLMLKEGTERNYAADTEGSRDKTASQTVRDTVNKNPDATKVTVPADEINGGSDSTTKVQLPGTPDGYRTAQNLATKLGPDTKSTNFEFTIESKKEDLRLVEGVTFTKKELSNFLRSI